MLPSELFFVRSRLRRICCCACLGSITMLCASEWERAFSEFSLLVLVRGRDFDTPIPARFFRWKAVVKDSAEDVLRRVDLIDAFMLFSCSTGFVVGPTASCEGLVARAIKFFGFSSASGLLSWIVNPAVGLGAYTGVVDVWQLLFGRGFFRLASGVKHFS